ncbi:MAG TPA: hypothetical protein VHS27_06475 [Gaiellales bacterium]|nr:hypothetical protein [Gaiellales bacterium]
MRLLILVGILLAVIAVQPYEVVREALPYVGFVCALIIFWGMRERRRVAE